jgi:hypothetical protein
LQVFERIGQFIQPIASSPLVPRMDYTEMTRDDQGNRLCRFPVESTMYLQGRPNLQQTVNKIERTTIPAGTYDLPAGLTKRDMPGMPR